MSRHTLVLVFDGDPKDLFAALDGVVDIRQAQLGGWATDLENLPAHRSEEARARTQSDESSEVRSASLVEDKEDEDVEAAGSQEANDEAPQESADESVSSDEEDQGSEAEPEVEGQAAVLAIQFASAAAVRLANKLTLSSADIRSSGVEASSKKGFTVGDVRKVIPALTPALVE